MTHDSGKQKIILNKRLGDEWGDLADYFGIDEHIQEGFAPGHRGRYIWKWLKDHDKLEQLQEALKFIGREDLVVALFEVEPVAVSQSQKQRLWTGSPFPGLRDFTEAEAPIFFGRDAEIQSLLAILDKSRFVAVVGASGSGKSSLVRAGVIPKLGEVPGGGHWRWLRFTPGLTDDPFVALAAKLAHALQVPELTGRGIADQLRARGDLPELVEPFFKNQPAAAELLLFIDQFEELFTLTDPAHHHRFIATLNKAVETPCIRIILTVRADFIDRCIGVPLLASLMNTGFWHLAPPDMTALWRMVTGPAAAAGLEFENGLPERILRDTGTEPGALALMAYALEQLYLARGPNDKLTSTAYDSFGGVKDAIGRHAEEAYRELDDASQNALGEVFSELVTVDPERGVPTRKRAFLQHVSKSLAAKRLVDAFIAKRLLVTGRVKQQQDGGNAAIVEVAHEALLTRWPFIGRLDQRTLR